MYTDRLWVSQEVMRLYTHSMDNPVVAIIRAQQALLTAMKRKPSTDTIPAIDPMMRAPHGLTTMSAAVPTATPPARVAFWM